MNGHVVECRAGNGLQSSTAEWARETLDLKYDPIVSVNIGPVEMEETQSGSLSCTVDSKPLSTITWSREDSRNAVPTNRLVKGSNSLGYMITSAQRENAGQYRCTAHNGYGGNKFNNTTVVVRYSPDVVVVTQNTTANAPSVDIRCYPSGVPATYTYVSWKQVWPGYGVVRTFSGSDVLTLTSLTYEDSGLYSCEVENGARYSRNPGAGQGQALLNILSNPVILNVETTVELAVQIGNVSEFSVDFFSNTQEIQVHILKENSESKSNIASTEIMPKRVILQVFDHSIEVGGSVARTLLNVTKEEELGSYNMFVQNSIGSRSLSIRLIPEGPPSAPTIISVNNVLQTSAVLTWNRGFHGGLSQTVYVELSIDRQRWDVKLQLFEGKYEDENEVNTTLQELQPGTVYYVRMYAENERGQSDRSRIFDITLLNNITTKKTPQAGLTIGGSIGGVIGAIVVIVVVVVILRRKYALHCNVFTIRENESLVGRSISGTDNPENNATKTYEDVSMATDVSVYDALKNEENGPDDSHVYTPLAESSSRSHVFYENVKKEDPVYNNTVLKNPVQTVL